jgi:uncharacterized membrane protein
MMSSDPEANAAFGEVEAVAARQLSARERAPFWGLRLHTREALSRSLVLIPSLYLMAAVVIGIVLPLVDRSRRGTLLLGVSPAGAESILESVAAGMIAFSGLVVSVAVLVVQFAAGQYSPRLVQSFRRDPVIKNALGLFVAPGVYALVAVADAGGNPRDGVGTLTVCVALALMVAALVALFGYIGRLLDLMRPRRIYTRLLTRFAAAIEEVYPQPVDRSVVLRPLERLPVTDSLRHRHRDEVLVGVDRARLVAAARMADATIELTVPIGAYVRDDVPILLVRGGAPIDVHVLLRALTFADGRRLPQDPAFAVRCIVDVALRALSAAINDPTSAMEGVDALEAALARLGHRWLDGSAILDAHGAVRLLLPSPGWEELVELALSEVCWYGAGTPQVARRLAALLEDLMRTLPPERQAALRRQRRTLDTHLSELYADREQLAFLQTPDLMGVGGSVKYPQPHTTGSIHTQ